MKNMRTQAFLGCVMVLTAGALFAEPTTTPQPAGEKEKVLGIGGLFFRAKNPKALRKWYLDNLGVNVVPRSYGDKPWKQEAGTTAFAPFSEGSDYFGDPSKVWMVDFRVRNLDAMVVQLRAAGIAVKVDPQAYPNGRFARLTDPEGNPIELWEEAVEAKPVQPSEAKGP